MKALRMVLFLLLSSVSWAQSRTSNTEVRKGLEKNGCEAATDFLAIAEIYAISGVDSEAPNYLKDMKAVQSKACKGEFSATDSIQYSSGATATSRAGDASASWFWPNGQTIINSALGDTSTAYYPNGNIVSTAFRTAGSTFNYPDGRTISSSAGTAGSGLNDINGNSLTGGSPSFEVGSAAKLDVRRFLAYVKETNTGVLTPAKGTACSTQEVDQRLERTVQLLQGSQNILAAQEIGALRACL